MVSFRILVKGWGGQGLYICTSMKTVVMVITIFSVAPQEPFGDLGIKMYVYANYVNMYMPLAILARSSSIPPLILHKWLYVVYYRVPESYNCLANCRLLHVSGHCCLVFVWHVQESSVCACR